MSPRAIPGPPEKHRWDALQSEERPASLDIEKVSADILSRFIGTVLGSGDAVTFGRSSDGGALLVSLLSGGTPHKYYFSSVEALENRMKRYIEAM